jgi:hypothetical protein
MVFQTLSSISGISRRPSSSAKRGAVRENSLTGRLVMRQTPINEIPITTI